MVATLVTLIYFMIPATTSQECADAVGNLNGDRAALATPVDTTYILDGYTIPCSGIVVAWEFFYQITGSPLARFNPGIWKKSRSSGVTYYTLVQSSNITFDPRGSGNPYRRLRVDIPESEQFIAPAGSVVGLYSGTGAQILRTNPDNSIATYAFTGNHTRVNNTGNVNHSIEIRVHVADIVTVTVGPTTSIVSTSATTTVTPTTSIVSTSDTTTCTVTPTTSIVSTSDTTTVTHDHTNSTVPADDAASVMITTAMVSSNSEDIMIPVTSTTTALDADMSNNSGSDNGALVGGVVVGVILVMVIIAVLCIVILYMKRRGRKAEGGTPMLDRRITAERNTYNATNSLNTLNQVSGNEQMGINQSGGESGTNSSTNSDTNEQQHLQNDATQENPHAQPEIDDPNL